MTKTWRARCLLAACLCAGWAWPGARAADNGRMAVSFEAREQTPYFVMVRGTGNELVRCIASAAGPAGPRTVAWDGKDTAGREAAPGVYRVYLSAGIGWRLDRRFGTGGRIGRHETMQVAQTASPPIRVRGVADRVTVNGLPYARAAALTGTNAAFTVARGRVAVNPRRLNPGDTVRVVSYDTCFLENPWDLAVGGDGSLYVLLRWVHSYREWYPSTLVKLRPDGRAVDTAFGVDGEIPFILQSQQVILAPSENRLYIAGSHWYSWGTGAFKMDSGAFWFRLGDSGDDPASTYLPSGVCLGRGKKIYIGDLKVYDRTRRVREGFLYAATGRIGAVRPGPCMERAPEEDMFYMTGWSTGIAKMRDTGSDVTEQYSQVLPFKAIGVSADPERRLVYAGARDPGGFVAVLYDDGAALQEVARLADDELGGIHTVRSHAGRLFVVEDGAPFTADGRPVVEPAIEAPIPAGKNRISRYRIRFGREKRMGVIRKP